MKNVKVLAIAIAAMALAVACNTKEAEPVINQDSIDSVAAAEEARIADSIEQARIADSIAAAEQAAAATPAKKVATSKEKTVKEVAKEEADKVAKKAITTGAQEASNAIEQNKGKANPFKK